MADHPIRYATPADLPRLAEIERACFGRRDAEDALAAELTRAWARIVVAERDGELAGFVNFWRVADEVEVLFVATAPAWQRQGVARGLLRHVIALVRAVEPDLEPWLSLQYLAALRPSEVPRLVLGQGDWHEPELGRFVFKMRGKTSARTRQARYIVLSPEAMAWLDRARAGHSGGPGPRWKSADGYGHALGDLWADPPPAGVARDPARRAALAVLRQAFRVSPGVHFLRHSAFDALLRARVPHAEARLLIGHAVPGSWPHYSPGAWHAWRGHMAHLSLASTPAATPVPPLTPT